MIVVVSGTLMAAAPAHAQQPAPVRTVASVDLDRYLGGRTACQASAA